MCARPFTLLKAAFDPLFPLDSIIMFEQDGAPDLAYISGMKKDKYLAITSADKEMELTKPRLHKVPGTFPVELKTREQKVAFLQSLCSASENGVDLEDLWKQCEQEKVLHEAAICKLLFQNVEIHSYVQTRFALIRDRIFFKRDKDGFSPRPKQSVEQLKLDQANRAQKLQRFEECAHFLKLRCKDKTLPIPPELEFALDVLKNCAADAPGATETMIHDAEDLVSLCEKASHHEAQGHLPDRAFHILYKAGILKKDANLAIIRHKPKMNFNPDVFEQAEKLQVPQTLEGYSDQNVRIDLTHLHTVTIDDESTRDMDDALSLEETDSGYTLYVHISDVASIIPRGSPLDQEALARATSIYCPEITIPMLPEHLSHHLLSLTAGEVRPAITCIFEVDRNYAITHATIVPSIVKVTQKLSYTEVDAKLEKQTDRFLSDLHCIAATHEGKRLSQGAMPVIKRDAQAAPAAQGEIKLTEIDEQSPARALIGEMMVLSNCVMANFLQVHNVPCLYRSQELPEPISEREMQKIPEGPARDYAERGRLKRSVVDLKPGLHATLGVQAYIQCTSPIRRYLDLVLQRQILAVLRQEASPYSNEELLSLAQAVEEPLAKALAISKETKRTWILRYLEKYYLHTKRIKGTVVRTDTKMPMVELDEVFIIAGARIQNPKLGHIYTLNVQHVDPRSDYLRLEEFKPKQNRL